MSHSKVLVCGGRDYKDRSKVYEILDIFHKEHNIELIIQGGATGADLLASDWAKSKLIPTRTFMANWSKFGPSAGPLRNKEMLSEGKPDFIIAFPGGKGTQDMINRAKRAALPIYLIKD